MTRMLILLLDSCNREEIGAVVLVTGIQSKELHLQTLCEVGIAVFVIFEGSPDGRKCKG